MDDRRRGNLATLAAVPLIAVAVLVPAAWFIREGQPDGLERRVLEQVSTDEVELTGPVLDRIEELPERFESIPVINYHDISDRESPYAMSWTRFAEHMEALEQADVTAVGIRDVQEFLSGEGTLPDRPVLITFDDGANTDWTTTDPILERHGFRGVSYLITSALQLTDTPYYLNDSTIRAMHDSGRWEFGGHTNDQHRQVETSTGPAPALLNLELREDGTTETRAEWRRRIAEDLDRNVERITELTGSAPASFAYPFSAVDTPTNDPGLPDDLASMVGQRFELQFTASEDDAAAIDFGQDTAPMRRLAVKGETTAEGLIAALVRMTPPHNPEDLSTASWAAAGPGTCVIDGASLVVSAPDYTACRTVGYRPILASAAVAARFEGFDRNATAVLGFDGDRCRVELAIGESRAELRIRDDEEWTVVGEAPVIREADRSVSASVTVQMDAVTAVAGGQPITGTCPAANYSSPLLAVASEGGQVRFVDPVLVEGTPPGARPSEGLRAYLEGMGDRP